MAVVVAVPVILAMEFVVVPVAVAGPDKYRQVGSGVLALRRKETMVETACLIALQQLIAVAGVAVVLVPLVLQPRPTRVATVGLDWRTQSPALLLLELVAAVAVRVRGL
jgi:hypothetical protein